MEGDELMQDVDRSVRSRTTNCSWQSRSAPTSTPSRRSSITGVEDPIAELRNVVASTSPPPAEMDAYLEKVRDRAYTIVDRDVDALTEAGFSEDEIFEQTVALAIAEGLRRLDRAAEVIR
jgi:alkylhydroperoxidase family enzyme